MKKLLHLALILLLFSFQADNYTTLRHKMVKEQIKAKGIKNQAVIKAMETVPRHKFVPEEQIENAYEDRPLPIGFGQTISQPYIVGYMTNIIEPHKNHKVLEIGTGSGYQAAVLSQIVSEVYTIEIIKSLGEKARERLKNLGYSNVYTKIGDGYQGWPEHAPYDGIIVTAAPERVPQPLIDQLKEGGKLIIPVGSSHYTQYLVLIEKKKGELIQKNMLPVRFVPFTRE